MSRILLEAYHIQKSFGGQIVLNLEELHIYNGDRIALIGENGAGKSTFLSILAGEMIPDAGFIRRYGSFAVIHQSGEANRNGSAHLVSEFRVPQREEGLSGGEKTRRRIAEALSENAMLLMADEPTTDLDASGVERLKRFLLTYKGALLLVSHDRSLLNALCTRVWHLEDGKISDFPGKYADYQTEMQRRRNFQQFKYDQYRIERARLKTLAQRKAEWAASVQKAPKRMGNSEARLHTREYTNAVLRQSAEKKIIQNKLDRLEKKERPRDIPEIRMVLGVSRSIGAKTAVSVRCNFLRAGNRTLISDADFFLPTGSRTALLGDNGSGKTTLLRALRGELPSGLEFQGEIRINPGALVGVFDQDHQKSLLFEKTMLENVMIDSHFSESIARTILARLGFRGDQVFKPVRVLSGGERAKVAIAKLLLSDVNLLLLDEPTNHLDLFAMEALETMLSSYGGTLLFVSHDQTFVSNVANRILRIEQGGITVYEDGLKQIEKESRSYRVNSSYEIEISSLEMRMAALTVKMSALKKGESLDQLSAEYNTLANELREWKLKQRSVAVEELVKSRVT